MTNPVSVCSLCVFDNKGEISVMEGDSVTINSGLTEMMDDDVIQWRFWIEGTLIAEISKEVDSITVYDVLDGRFRDRLKLDKQTGSLTITDTTTEQTGTYELQINIYSRFFFYLTVYGELNISFTCFIYYRLKVDLKKRLIMTNLLKLLISFFIFYLCLCLQPGLYLTFYITQF